MRISVNEFLRFCVYWSGTIGFQPKFTWGKTVVFFFLRKWAFINTVNVECTKATTSHIKLPINMVMVDLQLIKATIWKLGNVLTLQKLLWSFQSNIRIVLVSDPSAPNSSSSSRICYAYVWYFSQTKFSVVEHVVYTFLICQSILFIKAELLVPN